MRKDVVEGIEYKTKKRKRKIKKWIESAKEDIKSLRVQDREEKTKGSKDSEVH